MSNLIIGVTTFLYAGQACVELFQGRPAFGLVFAAYSLANIGLILAK